MNNPNRAINVNLSSLLSLKAELLRKQAEVSKTKAQRNVSEEYSAHTTISAIRKQKDKNDKLTDNVEDSARKDNVPEDSELLAKSQRVLEKKSKFYERMSRTGGQLNSDDNCLVMFNRKQQEARSSSEWRPPPETHYCESEPSSSSADENNDDDDNDAADDPEDDWVEYTDCLGRTRKCLRRDLVDVKKRDAELVASMPERLDQSKPNWMIDTKGTSPQRTDDADDATIGPLPPESVFSDGCSFMSKHDEQRANWERKEQENVDKMDVHYQDVFFDEARQHGVGYYGFSTDEEERHRQQHELDEARQQTIGEQERRDELRAQRERIIAERVRAAKNRQRQRLGLPALTEADEIAATKEKPETGAEAKARKRAEKLARKQERAEVERERERKQHVRPWDEEKSGGGVPPFDSSAEEPEWTYKPERLPMSQEEWNERQRAARNPEFAPPTSPACTDPAATPYQQKRTNFTSMPPPPPPFPTAVPPLPPQYTMAPPPAASFSIYQSTKRKNPFHRRNYQQADEDECDDDNSDRRRTGAAIPPPSNLDDTLPTHAKRSKTKSNDELERSIEAGLRFLRNNCDKTTAATKSSWTAKADY